eukprot:2357929-Prymnesium_polylepis.1
MFSLLWFLCAISIAVSVAGVAHREVHVPLRRRALKHEHLLSLRHRAPLRPQITGETATHKHGTVPAPHASQIHRRVWPVSKHKSEHARRVSPVARRTPRAPGEAGRQPDGGPGWWDRQAGRVLHAPGARWQPDRRAAGGHGQLGPGAAGRGLRRVRAARRPVV